MFLACFPHGKPGRKKLDKGFSRYLVLSLAIQAGDNFLA